MWIIDTASYLWTDSIKLYLKYRSFYHDLYTCNKLRHLFAPEPFSWLDCKLAVEERQCIHFQEELNPYRLNCKDNSCLAKSEDFPPESKKFIYCFPILLLSVSAGQRAGQRPLHLQHSYWLSQTNLSDSLIVPHWHESLIATNIYLVWSHKSTENTAIREKLRWSSSNRNCQHKSHHWIIIPSSEAGRSGEGGRENIRIEIQQTCQGNRFKLFWLWLGQWPRYLTVQVITTTRWVVARTSFILSNLQFHPPPCYTKSLISSSWREKESQTET